MKYDLQTSCPRCGATVRAIDEWVGRLAACNGCGTRFRIARAAEKPAAEPASSPSSSDGSGGSAVRNTASEPAPVTATAAPLLASAAPPRPAPQYYYHKDGRSHGPFLLEQMRQRVASGEFSPDDLVWWQGASQWVPARDVSSLFPAASRPIVPERVAMSANGGSAPSPPVGAPASPPSGAAVAAPSPFAGIPRAQPAPQPALSAQPQVVLAVPLKSVAVSLILTFFLGPLGMLYSTVPGGLIMTAVHLFLLMFTFCTAGWGGILFFVTWPICFLWGALAANAYNERLLHGRGQH